MVLKKILDTLKQVLLIGMAVVVIGEMSGNALAAPKLSEWAEKPYNAAVQAHIVPESMMADRAEMQGPITREEYAEMMVKYFMIFKPQELKGEDVFTDTLNPMVQLAGRLGVVNGIGDGKFDPNGKLTREQASTMFNRVDKKIHENLRAGAKAMAFSDVGRISDWAKDGVAQMNDKGVIKGFPDGSFKPQNTMTREQAVVVAARMLKDEGKVVFDESTPKPPVVEESSLNFQSTTQVCNEVGIPAGEWITTAIPNGMAVVHAQGNKVNIPWGKDGKITGFDISRIKYQTGDMQDKVTITGVGTKESWFVDYSLITTDGGIMDVTGGNFYEQSTLGSMTSMHKKVYDYKGILVRVPNLPHMVDGKIVRDGGKGVVILFDKPTTFGNPTVVGQLISNNW